MRAKLRALRPTRSEALAALASAALFAIAFPPFDLIVPVFICLVPVALAVAERADAAESWRSSARIGFWFGLVAYGVTLYWLAVALRIYTNLAILGWVGALLVLTPLVVLTTVALFVARRATKLPLAILVPVVWVALEVVLDYLPELGFPWLPLGLAMSHHPLMAQAADLSGVRGLSFWIAAINGLVADAWLLRGRRSAVAMRAGAIAALVALVAAYGAWRLRTTRLRPVAPIAIVQPNVPQEEKWQQQNQGRIVGMLSELTRERLARHDAALVLWPEVALPGFLVDHPDWADTMRVLAGGSRTPILFGVLDVTWRSRTTFDYFNAAMLADSTGRIGTQRPYHKTYLVPVVERVPFLNPRWFEKLHFFGGFGRGVSRPPTFHFPFGSMGVLICYESIFPQRSRLYRREGASLIANITNDAWFGRSIAVHQHFAHLPLRAIENRVGIVRAANTGISAYIDPLGRVHGATDIFVPATRTYQAQTTDVRTLYVRIGDWVGTLSVLGTLVAVALAFRRRREP